MQTRSKVVHSTSFEDKSEIQDELQNKAGSTRDVLAAEEISCAQTLFDQEIKQHLLSGTPGLSE